jgi:hypothetical protein
MSNALLLSGNKYMVLMMSPDKVQYVLLMVTDPMHPTALATVAMILNIPGTINCK